MLSWRVPIPCYIPANSHRRRAVATHLDAFRQVWHILRYIYFEQDGTDPNICNRNGVKNGYFRFVLPYQWCTALRWDHPQHERLHDSITSPDADCRGWRPPASRRKRNVHAHANSSTSSLWSNQWWVSSSPPSSSIFRKHFNISQARYQSIHEEKSLTNIYFYYSASISVPVLYIPSTILDANSIKFESIPKMSSDNIRLSFASYHWQSWRHRFEVYDLVCPVPSGVLYTLWTRSRP